MQLPPGRCVDAAAVLSRAGHGGRRHPFTGRAGRDDDHPRHIGKTGTVITLHSRAHSAACGVTFEKGKRQLFAFARHNGRYITNLCLMLQARL